MRSNKGYLLEQTRNNHLVLMDILDQLDDLADEAYLSGESAQRVLNQAILQLHDVLVLEIASIRDSVAKCSCKSEPRS